MEYVKCENYPRCAFTECECYQKMLFELHTKSDNNKSNTTKSDNNNLKIIRFEIIDDQPKPVYQNDTISKSQNKI
jgi:hypothetical protein